MDTSRFCHESVLNNPLTWPEAVTGYKLTADTVDAVKDTIATWRSSEEGHLPSLTWVYNGGDPENGGSEYGIWGDPSVGLLVSKIVVCEDIPDRIMYYRYPEDVAISDYVDPETNITIAEEIYNWWTSTCGYVDGAQVCGPYVPPEPTCQPWCADCAPCQACVGYMEMDECAECKPCSPCEVCWEEEGSGESDNSVTDEDETNPTETDETNGVDETESTESSVTQTIESVIDENDLEESKEIDEMSEAEPEETSVAETKEDSAAYLWTSRSRIMALASSLSLAILVCMEVV